jgi:hypothetical protein
VTGMTLHSWGAIAPSIDNVDKLLSYIKTARPALMRWKRTQILIIDEGTATFRSLCVCHGELHFGYSVDGGWAFV